MPIGQRICKFYPGREFIKTRVYINKSLYSNDLPSHAQRKDGAGGVGVGEVTVDL